MIDPLSLLTNKRISEYPHLDAFELAVPIARFCKYPTLELQKFVEKVCFYLLSNANITIHSFGIARKKTGNTLSAIYDLSPWMVSEHYPLALNGKSENINSNDILQLGLQHGLKEKQMDNIFDHFLHTATHIAANIDSHAALDKSKKQVLQQLHEQSVKLFTY